MNFGSDYFDYFNDYFNDFYGYGNNYQEPKGMSPEGVLLIVAAAAALVGIFLCFTLFRKKNEGRFRGFWGKVYNCMTLNRFYTEDLMRWLTIITFVVLTAVGITEMILGHVVRGIVILVPGNLAARLTYELTMMFVILVRKSVSMDRSLKEMDERLKNLEEFYSDDFSDWEDDGEMCDGECGLCHFDCDLAGIDFEGGEEYPCDPEEEMPILSREPEKLAHTQNIIYAEGPVAEHETAETGEKEEFSNRETVSDVIYAGGPVEEDTENR